MVDQVVLALSTTLRNSLAVVGQMTADDYHIETMLAPNRKYFDKYYNRASIYIQLWIIGVILLLTVLNVYRKIKHLIRLRHLSSPRREGYKAITPPPSASGIEVRRSAWKRYKTALGAGWRNTLYLRGFPVWLYMPETVADALWTALYCLVYGFFCLRKTDSWWPTTHTNVANQIGVMSFSQMPIIIITIGKNNPISSLTGITYQKLNYIHRASARACLFTSWLHAILWTPRVWEAGDTRPYLLWGIAALSGYTLLWLTSFRIVRRLCYEFFIVAHIIFTLLYLIGAYYHWTRLHFWVWPALGVWVLDRLVRGIRTLYINRLTRIRNRDSLGECRIELLEHDVMRVTVPRRRFNWKAGQHAFISAPSVSASPHETHPFSIANVPSETSNEVHFLVRIHTGFTKRLREKLESDISTAIPLYLDGPYGTTHSLDSYSTVLLLAGGTGVTFVSSHLLQLLANARNGHSAVKKIHLVWHIRHAEDIEWITPLLNEAVIDLPDVDVLIDVYVTKTHASDEPYDPPEDSELQLSLQDRIAEVGPKLHLMRFREDHSHEIWDEGCRTCAPATPITESRDEQIWLPQPQVARRRFGLSKEAAEIVRWKKGRADLNKIVEEDRRNTPSDGAMNVSVCGPVQLLDAAKKAVREVSTMRSSIEGLPSIDFFEETLGA